VSWSRDVFGNNWVTPRTGFAINIKSGRTRTAGGAVVRRPTSVPPKVIVHNSGKTGSRYRPPTPHIAVHPHTTHRVTITNTALYDIAALGAGNRASSYR